MATREGTGEGDGRAETELPPRHEWLPQSVYEDLSSVLRIDETLPPGERTSSEAWDVARRLCFSRNAQDYWESTQVAWWENSDEPIWDLVHVILDALAGNLVNDSNERDVAGWTARSVRERAKLAREVATLARKLAEKIKDTPLDRRVSLPDIEAALAPADPADDFEELAAARRRLADAVRKVEDMALLPRRSEVLHGLVEHAEKTVENPGLGFNNTRDRDVNLLTTAVYQFHVERLGLNASAAARASALATSLVTGAECSELDVLNRVRTYRKRTRRPE